MDRISELPDELLLKILLKVPTKVAVSTSILSKRWRYLWMWLPKLKFGHMYILDPECARLQSFLDRNLPLHRAPVIESFCLDMLRSRFKQENISMWVSTALSHCLRELDISHHLSPPEPNILPSNLYTCKSLVILKLLGGILLDVPRMVSLPSLKTLKLRCVKYFDDKTLRQRLLSNCPVLENLEVNLNGNDTRGKLSVVVPSLQSLSLVIPHDHEIDELLIETPALKYFKLKDHSSNDHYCLIDHMPNLIEAHLDLELPDNNSVIGSITSVKRLAICSTAMVDEGFVFNQLEHLELCLCQEHLPNQLIRLLNASPNVEGLHLFYMDDPDSPEMDDWNQPTTVPECILSSLQSFSWSLYSGEPHEREIAVYILKHALHLKSATIKSCGSAVLKLEMLKELALSSRASAACQLTFE